MCWIRCDCRRLRELARTSETRRWRPDGSSRPFAGLNVIFAEDFWQLDPPQATSLAQVPDFLLPAAKSGAVSGEAEHGLGLVWGKGADGPTGLTELLEQKRPDDAWYTEVLEECRAGALSDDNHAFLHGAPTTVPGSWVNGAPDPKTCQSPAACAKLRGRPWPELAAKERPGCAADRASRCHVLPDPIDPAAEEAARAIEPAITTALADVAAFAAASSAVAASASWRAASAR